MNALTLRIVARTLFDADVTARIRRSPGLGSSEYQASSTFGSPACGS